MTDSATPEHGDDRDNGEDADEFDPTDLPRCGAGRCPEIAEFYVTREHMDDPVDELRCAEHATAEGFNKERPIPDSETQIPDAADDGSAICFVADTLTEGDVVLFNDRSRTLQVTGRHKKPITKTYRRRGSTRDYYDIIELSGNGTNYHYLFRFGSTSGGMLRKESEWTEVETEDGVEYEYVGGERVTAINIVKRGEL